MGDWAEAFQTARPLVDRRDRLTAFERGTLDWLIAEGSGRRTEALAALLEAQKLNPGSFIVNYLVAVEYYRLNRLKSAMATFAAVRDPRSVEMRGAAGLGGARGAAAWLSNTAVVRHLVGDYAGELGDTQRAQHFDPASVSRRTSEARALVGLGRIQEALRVVDQALALPGATGGTLLDIVLELRAHGHQELSGELANRAVEWFRSRPPAIAAVRETRAGLGRALYATERWEEAQEVFLLLHRRFPDDVMYRGMLGVIAARRGDARAVAQHTQWLKQLGRPFLLGSNTVWRARIAAVQGRRDASVALLRDAFAQGAPFSIEIHRDIDLESLRGFTPFEELVRLED